MGGVERISRPVLDVLEELLNAHNHGVELHGWAIMHHTKRAGPTVYRVLDRLEDASWVSAHWEESLFDPTRPRRRLYRFTSTGLTKARGILAARHPKATVAAVWPRPRQAFGGWLTGVQGGAR